MHGGHPSIICLSGGLDSTSLLLHLLAQNRQVYGLSFDYGQKHSLELDRLQANLRYLRDRQLRVDWQLVDLTDISAILHSALTDPAWEIPEGYYESQNMKQTVVPNRNAIFVSIAYAKALSLANRDGCSVDLSLGVHAGDHTIYPDCTPQFYDAIFAAFRRGNWDAHRVQPYLPYMQFDKAKILRDAESSIHALDLDFDTVFSNTLTGYAPDESGRSSKLTGADVERILAFHELGRRDPLEYAMPWEEVVRRAVNWQREFKASAEDPSIGKDVE